jgi:hypothetical protein
MKYSIYDSQGNRVGGGSNLNPGSVSSGSGTTPMATYDRMDVGILALQQAYGPLDIYDFRVPGDPNKVTFRYKFPRDGFVLGVSFTGTVSANMNAGVFVQKADGTTGAQVDVMTPSDAGNTMMYDTTQFPNKGMLIMAPSPVPFKAGDLASMKFKSALNASVTVNLAGFLLVGLNPQ